MNKILVQIQIPAINETYDIFIPSTSLMYEILELLAKAVNSLAKGQFIADEKTILCYAETGSIVNINLSVSELGIQNGSKLMLI